jgi:CubicO group peptidase (beta-lactamase class C family)
VGSSFSYLTPRDWGKLGLLWLRDGVWRSPPKTEGKGEGEAAGVRLLPEGWVGFMRTPTPTSNGTYGAHFWLGGNPRSEPSTAVSEGCDALYHTREGGGGPPKTWLRDAFPGGSGAFLAHGFEEQAVAMVPSKGLVVVRLGASKEVVLRWEERKIALYRGVVDAFPDLDKPLSYSS